MATFGQMLKIRRTWLHIFFWLAYFGITFFNELFLTSDFAFTGGTSHFLRIFFSEFNLLIIKILLVYYVIYSLIPRWIVSQTKTKLAVEGAGVILITLFIYRGVIHFINWPLILHESPGIFSVESLIARFLFSFLEIMQIVAIAGMIKLFRMRIAAAEQEREVVRMKLRSEITQLRSQLNPHFLFNMLNSIYSLSRIQSPDTPDVVLKLSALLRFMIYESEKKQMHIADEVKIIEDFTALQKIRYADRVMVNCSFQIKDNDALITPLLLFPFVENAFKHGVGSTAHHSNINITLKSDNDSVEFRITNPIIHESVKDDNASGIGLSNIRKQLGLLYREFHLDTNERSGQFEATLNINLKSYAGSELYSS